MKRLYLVILILLLLGLTFFVLSSRKLFNKTYQRVEERPIKKLIYASGYVKPSNYVLIKAEVSGYVKRLYVKEGDYVKKGQILAVLEVKSLPSRVAELDARLALVEERLRGDSEFQKALKREIEIAKTNLLNEEKKLLRRKELYREGLLARESLDEAERSFQNAKDSFERIKNTYADTIRGLRTEKQALLEQKKALQEEVSKYYVRAPISGFVLKKYIDTGDFVNSVFGENRLFSLGTKDFEIVLEVDEEYAGQVKEGQRVYLAFDAYPHTLFEGEIFQVIKEVERNKRSFLAKARLFQYLDLPAQATAEANILLEERKALVIPLKALEHGERVEVKGRGKIQIRTGERFGDYLEVLSGLKTGEEVRVFE